MREYEGTRYEGAKRRRRRATMREHTVLWRRCVTRHPHRERYRRRTEKSCRASLYVGGSLLRSARAASDQQVQSAPSITEDARTETIELQSLNTTPIPEFIYIYIYIYI